MTATDTKIFSVDCDSIESAGRLMEILFEADIIAKREDAKVSLKWLGNDFAILVYEVAVVAGIIDYASASDQFVKYL